MEIETLKNENKDLEYQNQILRKQIDEIYKSWLFDSSRYNELKEKYNELKNDNKKVLEDYHQLLDRFNNRVKIVYDC